MIKKYAWVAAVILIAVFVGTLGVLCAGTAGPVQAGVAAAVKGDVKAVAEADAAVHALKSGDKVFMGDKVETGPDGQLQVLLLDQTVFTLGPLSAVKVDEFIYDPKTDDGKVKASMLKGIFRVVSGKIAHKRSENMSVNLPAGSIGFRGTNVAGIIDGQKSLIVLLGPVGVGRIYVTNVVNGEVVGVDIDAAGNATIVDGPNSAPVPVFQVSEADLSRIAGALGQQVTGSETTGSEPTGIAGPSGSGTGSSVNTQALINILNTLDTMSQESQTAAQDAASSSAASSDKKSSDQHQSEGNQSVVSVPPGK